jgi:hypothetical protein
MPNSEIGNVQCQKSWGKSGNNPMNGECALWNQERDVKDSSEEKNYFKCRSREND